MICVVVKFLLFFFLVLFCFHRLFHPQIGARFQDHGRHTPSLDYGHFFYPLETVRIKGFPLYTE